MPDDFTKILYKITLDITLDHEMIFSIVDIVRGFTVSKMVYTNVNLTSNNCEYRRVNVTSGSVATAREIVRI